MNHSAVKQESPLNQIDLSSLLDNDLVSVIERPFQGYIILRGKVEDSRFLEACEDVLGEALPTNPNTCCRANGVDVLWLGPAEWLLITPPATASELVEKLQASLSGIHSAVTEVSGGNTMLEISGEAATALLAKGSPFDFHPAEFRVGQCVQTVMAKTSATVFPVENGYKMVFRRSFADYLGVWLLDAVQEFVQHDKNDESHASEQRN